MLEIIEALNASERPVLLAGNGIRLSDGIEEFRKLIEILDIPVLTTWNGIDLIEEEHPLYLVDREVWAIGMQILSSKIRTSL